MTQKMNIGIDLGGTKIIGVLLTESFEKIAVVKKNTKAHLGLQSVVERIIALVDELLAAASISIDQIDSIGIGVPGPVDSHTRRIITAPNLGWKDVDLKHIIEKQFNCFTDIQNDVNAGTYAEYVLTLKKQFNHVVGMFVGTGLGGGIILNGQLFYGANGYAGEVGHMIIHKKGLACNCKNNGCLESYASKTGLMNSIKRNLQDPDLAEIRKLLENDPEFILKSSFIKKLIQEKNPYMLERIKKMANNIAIGMINLVNILNPEAIILGGGMMDALSDILLPQILKSLNRKAKVTPVHQLEIRIASLGDDAVMLGAALLAKESKLHQ